MTWDRRSPSGRCAVDSGPSGAGAAAGTSRRGRSGGSGGIERAAGCWGAGRPVAPPGGAVLVEGAEIKRDVMGRRARREGG